jgi:hypothetical protein
MIEANCLDAEHAQVGDREGAALEFLGLQLLGLGAGRQVLHLGRDLGQALGLGGADDRCDQTAVDSHGHGDVGMFVHGDAFRRVGGVGLRHALEGHGHGLDDDVVDRHLHTLVGQQVVDLAARGQQGVDLQIDRQREVRHVAEAVGQAARDGLAHAVQRDEVVGAGGDALLLERQVGARCGGAGRGGGRRGRSGLGGGRAALLSGFDVGLDHTAVRTGAGDRLEVQIRGRRQTTGQRRSEHAVAGRGDGGSRLGGCGGLAGSLNGRGRSSALGRFSSRSGLGRRRRGAFALAG